jgi:hypothetical protein
MFIDAFGNWFKNSNPEFYHYSEKSEIINFIGACHEAYLYDNLRAR